MSGICGVVSHLGRLSAYADCLNAMVGALRDHACGGVTSERTDHAALAVCEFPGRCTGIAKRTIDGSEVAVVFYGDLFEPVHSPKGTIQHNQVVEGVLSQYLSKGAGAFETLKGDFVVAIWDGRAEALYLATDRFRTFPLYYYQGVSDLWFATSLKPLLHCPFRARWTVNLQAVAAMVSSYVIPSPDTIYREVKKLPPGYVLEWQRGALRLRCYWDLSFLNPAQKSEAQLSRQLKEVLTVSVLRRLRLDNSGQRIGAFLSGGIDSSTVVMELSLHARPQVHCFSIGFAEAGFDELNYARLAAKSAGVVHHEYYVTPKDVRDAIPLLVQTFDEPYGNSSAVATYYCAKLAADNNISVLFAGDGGDELFAGNTRYATQRLFEYYHDIPSWLRTSLLEPSLCLIGKSPAFGLAKKLLNYVRRANQPYVERLNAHGLYELVPIDKLFCPDALREVQSEWEPEARCKEWFTNAPARTNLDRHLYLDMKVTVADCDLPKVVRMTEAAGVVVRFPFLDLDVAEFAARVPASLKMKGLRLRSFFKNAYKDRLPREIIAKRKHGFGVPIALWLRSDPDLNAMMRDLLLSPQALQRGYFQKGTIESLVQAHEQDRTTFYGTILWNLMMLELWHRLYFQVGHQIHLSPAT